MEIREAADIHPTVVRLINRIGPGIAPTARAVRVDRDTVRHWIRCDTTPSLAAWADLLEAAGARLWVCWKASDIIIANQGPITTPEDLLGALVGLLRSRGITQTVADRAAHLSDGTISRWRHGKTGPRLDVLLRVFRAQGAWLRVEVSA